MPDQGRIERDGGWLPARSAPLVTALILSIAMTMLVSAMSTLRGVGLSPEFVSVWLSAWALSWVAAFPTLLILLPLARRTANRLCRRAEPAR